MANLASTLWKEGRWDEAEKLEVQMMETRKTKARAGPSRHADEHGKPSLHYKV
jgi:hypothetical protein